MRLTIPTTADPARVRLIVAYNERQHAVIEFRRIVNAPVFDRDAADLAATRVAECTAEYRAALKDQPSQ